MQSIPACIDNTSLSCSSVSVAFLNRVGQHGNSISDGCIRYGAHNPLSFLAHIAICWAIILISHMSKFIWYILRIWLTTYSWFCFYVFVRWCYNDIVVIAQRIHLYNIDICIMISFTSNGNIETCIYKIITAGGCLIGINDATQNM